MNWSEVKLSADNQRFTYRGEQLFGKHFIHALKFHAPGMAPVCDQTGCYHITVSGDPLYTERYKRTFGFYCNRAAVVSHKGWKHITEEGIPAYQAHHLWTGNYQENICVVKNWKEDFFHIDLKGDPLYPERYTYAGDFKDDIACISNGAGKFTHIDTHGKLLHGNWFKMLGIYHKGFAIAMDERGWFHVDLKGKPVYPERYTYLEPFYNGVALAMTSDGRKVYVEDSFS